MIPLQICLFMKARKNVNDKEKCFLLRTCVLTPGDFSRRQSTARTGLKHIQLNKLLNLSQEDDCLQAPQGTECIYPTNSHAYSICVSQ